MLNKKGNHRQLYKLILKTFESNDAEQLIGRLRELSYHTTSTLQLYWSFADLYKAANFSSNEKQLFLIVSRRLSALRVISCIRID